ncbi:MAG: AAA family ATPase [Planctomycetes bacterium]|nr:AAA family ATPase [Planctomycetota bacterium]
MSVVDEALVVPFREELAQRVPPVLFAQWFARTEILACADGVLELGVQNRFFKSRIETRYLTVLREAAAAVLGQPVTVTVSVSPKLFAAFREAQEKASAEAAALDLDTPSSPPSPPRAPADRLPGLELNPDFVFDRFVVGASNRLSHAVALRSVERAGEYSRIYLCGQHGVGKTHLLQAVCHATREERPESTVIYMTGERFVADFVAAHAAGRIKEFRALYRSCDLLVFDEMQALGVGNKAATQTELLAIIDTLETRGKQVLFGATLAPDELEGIDPKLRDRLGAGFVDRLSLPDEATRRDLIVLKAGERGISLPEDAILLLARELTGNVRKLEGTLNRLVALMEIENMEPTVACIRMALEVSNLPSRRTALTGEDIIAAVAGEFGLTVEAIRGRGRAVAVRRARQLAIVLCRRLCGMRYTELGELFGGRSHATIISTVKKIPGDTFASGLAGRPLERILFRLGLNLKPEDIQERQRDLFA